MDLSKTWVQWSRIFVCVCSQRNPLSEKSWLHLIILMWWCRWGILIFCFVKIPLIRGSFCKKPCLLSFNQFFGAFDKTELDKLNSSVLLELAVSTDNIVYTEKSYHSDSHAEGTIASRAITNCLFTFDYYNNNSNALKSYGVQEKLLSLFWIEFFMTLKQLYKKACFDEIKTFTASFKICILSRYSLTVGHYHMEYAFANYLH